MVDVGVSDIIRQPYFATRRVSSSWAKQVELGQSLFGGTCSADEYPPHVSTETMPFARMMCVHEAQRKAFNTKRRQAHPSLWPSLVCLFPILWGEVCACRFTHYFNNEMAEADANDLALFAMADTIEC